MERKCGVEDQFTWVIKNYSHLEVIQSDEFLLRGCKWRLLAYPMGEMKHAYINMSLYLDVRYLPSGWMPHIRMHMTVVNQLSETLSITKSRNYRFNKKNSDARFLKMISLSKVFDEQGFMVDGKVMVVVKIEVLKVTDEVDFIEVSEEEESEEGSEKESKSDSEEASSPLRETKQNDDGNKSNDSHNKTQQMNVNGFQVLPSQVELVQRLFEKHPDMGLGVQAKNKILRTVCMNVLLSLIETLCQSPQKLSEEDLVGADSALTYVKDVGFKVDWLETKLKEVKAKKEDAQNSETRIQELEEELVDFKQKCLDTEALLEKAKVKVLAARASLTLDDFV